MSRGRVIGLISGKGGVGKTSIAVNLGIALQQMGEDVTLVDADFGASNLGVYLGRYDHPVKIQDVLHGDATPGDATFRHPTGLNVITSSNEIDQVEPDVSELQDILNAAAKNSDYVLVDCPPGLNSMVETIMASVDELLIVTMPTQTSGLNAAQIIEKAKHQRQSILGTVVNMVEDDPERELVDREVEMMTESHVLSKIPYDSKVKEALFHNEPVLLYEPLASASLEINQLAADLSGQQYERPKFANVKRKLKNFKQTISS